MAVVAWMAAVVPAEAEPSEPWQAADTIREAMSTIGRALYRDDTPIEREVVELAMREAEAAYRSTLAGPFSAIDASLGRRLGQAFLQLRHAVPDWSAVPAARARGTISTGLLEGAYRRGMAALAEGDVRAGQRWLSIREYARAAGDTAATEAIESAIAGRMTPERAHGIVESEFLRTYAGELRRSLAELSEASQKGYQTQVAYEAARASGLSSLLTPNLVQRLGESRARELSASIELLQGIPSPQAVAAAVKVAARLLEGYSPVALTPQERDRRAQLLLRFLRLVHVEYKDGVRDGRITIHLEYEEARLFRDRAAALFGDLSGDFLNANPDTHARLAAIMSELFAAIESKASPDRVKELTVEAIGLISAALGVDAGGRDHVTAFRVLPEVLDEIVQLARGGDYPAADVKRLEAYSYFDPDIEQRLMPRSPALSLQLESMFWEGNRANPGLGKLLADRASPGALSESVARLNAMLDEANSTLARKLSAIGAFAQALAIILREGLEAVLVIASVVGVLRASGAKGYHVRILSGSTLAIAASFALWLAAGRLIEISTVDRELLEGATALAATAVIIYVTSWVFHQAYVVDWIALAKQRARDSVSAARPNGLAFLSFAVVFREGFETVLFYEALMIDSSPSPVIAGFAAGLIGTVLAAYWILRLGLRLPVGAFFKATGALLILLAVALTGAGIRGLQTADLVSATPISVVPESSFLQLYFGLFPVAEPIAAQAAVVTILLIGWLWMRSQGGRDAKINGGRQADSARSND